MHDQAVPDHLKPSIAAVKERLPRIGMVAKLPEDLDRYEVVMRKSRPELVIETGTHQGYSAEWFASHGVDVVTIDVVSGMAAPMREFGPHRDRITYIHGNSVDPALISYLAELRSGRRTMVALDSDHTAPHVRAEIRSYGPLVTPSCYLVVEDGLARWLPDEDCDPLAAIEDLLVGNPEWVRDEEIENLHPVSTSPMGWWRRA